MAPLAIDLYCGLGGWTEGLIAEGYRVVGFDIERHVYGEHQYPAQLVLQDVLTIHGRQFKDAALIVASPPCQGYSYRAMPWKRAKALPPPDNSLFEACFRIQREACEASGRYIPLVVENVRGAQKWVGRSRFHFGSFHLWGDVPALMPNAKVRAKSPGQDWNRFKETGEVSQWNWANERDVKLGGGSLVDAQGNRRISEAWRSKAGQDAKGLGGSWFGGTYAERKERWPGSQVTTASKSPARRAASAMIAKIPLVLSRHIAKAWYPVSC